MVDLAIRNAYARRTVSHITVPNDIQVADADADPWQHVAPARPPHTAPIMLSAPGRPNDEDLQRLADLLNDGKKIAILAGAGARHAREELLALAETLDAPIVKTLSGKATVPDDSPYTTGGIGLLGTRPSEDLMEEIDTLFLVGTNFPYTKHLPEAGKVRIGQIEADPARAGGRIATEVPVVGRRQGGPGRACCRCSSSAPTAPCWRSTRRRWRSGARRWRPWRTPSATRSRRSTWWPCWTSWPPTTRCSPATAARSRPGPRGTG